MARSIAFHSKRLLSLALLGFLSLSASGAVAQEIGMKTKAEFSRSLWVIAKGGANLSRYSFNPGVPQSFFTGRHQGIGLRYVIERGAGAQIEINYLKTGWKEKFDAERLAYSREFTYVEMPILTHLYLGEGAVRVFVNLGPFVGYNLSESSKVEGNEADFSEAQLLRQSIPIKNKISWGLTGGPGLSLRLAHRHRLELDGRVTYSFTDVWGNKRTDPYGQSSELRFSASLSYLFRF